jgi:hypothetical protein
MLLKLDYVLIAAVISALGLIVLCNFSVYCRFRSRRLETMTPLILTSLLGFGGPVCFFMFSVLLEVMLFDYGFQDHPVFGFKYHFPIVVFGGCIAGLSVAIIHLRWQYPDSFRQDRNMSADYGEQSALQAIERGQSTDPEP